MSVINPTIPSEIFPKIVGNFSTPLSVINPTILSEIFSKIVGNFSTSLSVINPAILSEIFPKIFGQLKIQTSRKLFLMNWIFLRPNSRNYFQFYVGNISEYILGKIADPFGFIAVRLFSEIFPKNFVQCRLRRLDIIKEEVQMNLEEANENRPLTITYVEDQ